MKLKVLNEYKSAYPNPIAFEKGDMVRLGELDDEYPGWVRVTTEDGNEGWAPLAYVESSGTELAVANVGYSAQELNVEAGESVKVLKQHHGWAWCLSIRGKYGWLPIAVLTNA